MTSKHSDVTVASDPKRLPLTIRNGKTGYRVANTMPAAVGVYQCIRARNADAKPDDHLFFAAYPN